jgi:hypothetical protein
MTRSAVAWTAAIVVALGLGGRAGAQSVESLPPDATPPPRSPAPSPDAPPEETPATPPEGAPEAAAFGEAWHYAISLERAVGDDHVSLTQSPYGQGYGRVQGTSTTASSVSLFGVSNTGALAPFSFPRVAFDLFVPPHFSVGIGLGALYGSSSGSETGFSAKTKSFIGLLAAPRVGYALNLAAGISLWARGGISVVYSKVELAGAYPTPTSSRLVAATIELPIVFTVLPRLALTAGPTLDLTFSGHVQGLGQASYDEHVTELGIQVGVLIHL